MGTLSQTKAHDNAKYKKNSINSDTTSPDHEHNRLVPLKGIQKTDQRVDWQGYGRMVERNSRTVQVLLLRRSRWEKNFSPSVYAQQRSSASQRSLKYTTPTSLIFLQDLVTSHAPYPKHIKRHLKVVVANSRALYRLVSIAYTLPPWLHKSPCTHDRLKVAPQHSTSQATEST